MNPRAPKHVIEKLREARRISTMENANFGWDVVHTTARELTSTTFVKERSRLYRETWLIPVLDELLAWAENKPEGKG